MSQILHSLVSACLLSALAAVPAASAEVSGSFRMGSLSLEPSHITALRARDGNNPRQDRTVVFLSHTAMDEAAVAGQRDGYVIAINDPSLRGQDYLTVFISPDGHAALNARVGEVQYIESSQPMFGEPGSLKVDCGENTPARIACRVWVETPVKPHEGEAWSLDVRFSAAVIPKLGGTPLPADGGEPGKALQSFIKAVQGDDLEAIFALMSESRIGQHNASYNTPEENLASTKDIWSSRLPKTLKITGGEQVDAERAFVQGEGQLYEGMDMLFELDMTRRDGRWVVDEGGMIGMLR